ncbi:unnamed protein product [Bursaphelenchus xylophilus]|uniref:(pine wood nematode) hypothetical protein n=1 Tax=Bursaphelenchus xylophilus TaxID=6326 RepID=A0A1I7S3Q7_BURXY|nr:unnamed protein product [Bursaphelenchus xylophilus]CAG9116467.1 unnamed protein product [Bursaphelenchus xylophilus]
MIWLSLSLFLVTAVNALNEFQPKLNWECGAKGVKVSVSTDTPFFGVIHPIGIRVPECTARGTGGTVVAFKVDYERCQIPFDNQSNRRIIGLEVHEHHLLLLEQDEQLEFECRIPKKGVSTTVPTEVEEKEDSLPFEVDVFENETNVEVVKDVNSRSSSKPKTAIRAQPYEYQISLIPVVGAERTNSLYPEFGKPYDLLISASKPHHFRVHSCVAQSDGTSVELIASNGCTLDRKLTQDFIYSEAGARARIEKMFRFPDSSEVIFKCSFVECSEHKNCKPNCEMRLDDPMNEDPELVSKILRANSPDSPDIQLTWPKASSQAKTRVRVLERRELIPEPTPTSLPESASSITGCHCDLPADLIILYKLCIALSVFFALGCCCNILFCCLNAQGKNGKKKRPVPKTIPQSSLNSNQYWISDTASKHRGFDEFQTQFSEVPVMDQSLVQKRSSLSSYASLRPKSARTAENAVELNPTGLSTLTNSGFESTLNRNNHTSFDAPPAFHTPSNSSSHSPRDSVENQERMTPNNVNPNHLTSPPQYLTLTNSPTNQKETYSIL